jgi:hypothetical protein
MAVQLHDVNKDDKNARKISRFTKGLPDYYKIIRISMRLKISTVAMGHLEQEGRSVAGIRTDVAVAGNDPHSAN